jgi:hypothetical protein
MNRIFAAAIVAAGLSTFPKAAHAIELGTPAREHPYSSAQNFALEVRFSPYYPAVDDEPGLQKDAQGRGPFERGFGDNPRLYFGLELDWQTFRIPYVGTIGPGLSAGMVSMSRPAVTKENPPRDSGDEYTLKIYPFTLDAVLRADALWQARGFPIVPYGKLGLGYALWRASTSAGTSTSDDNVAGKGATFGTHVALGVSFALDAIDSGASRNMDNAIGINNTYIFAEYYWLNLNGLFQDSALYVGTKSWAAGLAFEF